MIWTGRVSLVLGRFLIDFHMRYPPVPTDRYAHTIHLDQVYLRGDRGDPLEQAE
jgi:hypothetical protein